MTSSRKLITTGIMLGIFLSALEMTVVGTATPKIIQDLGGFSNYSWVFTMYLFTTTISMPFWGRASDHWGRKPIFLICMILFLVGSVLCGFAQDFSQLIWFRGLKGLGGGGLLPIAFTILSDIYTIQERTKIQGTISSVWGVAALIGPFIGGAFADTIGWRWVFWVNVIPCLLGLWLVLKYLPHDKKNKEPLKLSMQSFLSSILIILAILMFLQSVQNQEWIPSIGFLVIGIFSLLLFIYSERTQLHPLIPKGLFKYRIFNMTCITGFLCSAIIIGLASFSPLLFQSVHGFTATESGMLIIPFTFSWIAGGIWSTRLLLRIHYKKLLFSGFLLTLIGMSLFMVSFVYFTTTLVLIAMAIMGLGMAFNYPIVLISTQYEVPKDQVGFSTSAIFWIRNIGSTIGTLCMGIILITTFQSGLMKLAMRENVSKFVDHLRMNPDILLSSKVISILKDNPNILAAYSNALFSSFLVMLIAAFVALLLSFYFPKKIRALE